MVAPGEPQDDVSRRENGIEEVPRDEPRELGRQTEPLPGVCRSAARKLGRPLRIDQRYETGFACHGFVEPLLAQADPRTGARIPGKFTHLEVVIREDAGSALALDNVVPRMGAPAHERFLVTPARQRQDPAFAGQAAIAHVLDETV